MPVLSSYVYVTMQRIPANADLSNALECLVSGKKSIRAMAYGMYVRTDLVDVVACPTRHAVESSIPVSTKKEGSALGFAGLACDRHYTNFVLANRKGLRILTFSWSIADVHVRKSGI